CRLRAKKKSYASIAADLKIKAQQAWGVVHDSVYRNVVGVGLWEAANTVKTPFGAPFLRIRALNIKQENQTNILLYLQRHGPSKASVITKDLKISDSAVYTNLRELKDRKKVDRESKKRFGRWFLIAYPGIENSRC
ncbi:hypothetical protein MUP38_00790, partial [Candidatus Bathyarchaeota archaeon]|nr:hypothetical protein [Candidatus Bathyarchaeota archaeon]